MCVYGVQFFFVIQRTRDLAQVSASTILPLLFTLATPTTFINALQDFGQALSETPLPDHVPDIELLILTH